MKYIEPTNQKTKPTHTTKIRIAEIRKKKAKNGSTIIQLVGKNGEIFFGFLSVWEQQHIDIETLNEGDEMLITYEVNGAFKNFVRV